ncbi:hypothetical protein ApDm4_2700 [Acetobacter pomorum]|nr:hypothetical protein ApDm4_2700 [Acetobacter pomorum]
MSAYPEAIFCFGVLLILGHCAPARAGAKQKLYFNVTR